MIMRKAALAFMALALLFAGCSKDGAPGKDGKDGINGIDGINGKDGTVILSGSKDPQNSVGKNGDYYLNLSTSVLFGPKTSSGWGDGLSLKGENGNNGSKILSGNGAPTSNIGNPGDFYLDKSSSIFYGPKNASNWEGGGLSLKGKDGNAGVTTFLYDNPYNNINPLNGENFFTFSLFPPLTNSMVESDAILIYVQTEFIDTLTGGTTQPGLNGTWSLLGSGGTLFLPVGKKGDFGYSIPSISTNPPFFLISCNYFDYNVRFYTINQVKYVSGISKFKIVVISSGSINHLSSTYHTDLSTPKTLRTFAIDHPELF